MEFSLSPSATLSDAKEAYQINQQARLSNVLDKQIAEQLALKLASGLDYVNAYYDKGQYATISQEKLAQMDGQERKDMSERLYGNAAKGIGFFFGRHAISLEEQRSANTQFAQDVLVWLNSEQMIAAVREITGNENIQSAKAQAMRLSAGHFITRHIDVLASEKRLVTFSLDLNLQWHSDWGGFTVFFDADGSSKQAWTPKFNTLDLFDVKYINSTSYVTPFCPLPRLSINGWFCG